MRVCVQLEMPKANFSSEKPHVWVLGVCIMCEWISLRGGITGSPIRAEISNLLTRVRWETPRNTPYASLRLSRRLSPGESFREMSFNDVLRLKDSREHRESVKVHFGVCWVLSSVTSKIHVSWLRLFGVLFLFFFCRDASCKREHLTTTSLRQQWLMRQCMSEHAHLGTNGIHVSCSVHTLNIQFLRWLPCICPIVSFVSFIQLTWLGVRTLEKTMMIVKVLSKDVMRGIFS